MDVRTISSCPDGGKLAVKAVTEMIYSIKSNAAPSIGESLAVLFNENTLAKVIGTAETYLKNNSPLTKFPETVPQSGPNKGIYQCRDAEFWTCGFFPGSLFCVLERLRKYPGSSISKISNVPGKSIAFQQCLITHLSDLCHQWAAPLYPMSGRKDTHDLGFIVQPALRRDWELFGNEKSLEALLHAADSLASRYDDRVRAIRSWDSFSNALHNITSMENDFLVIIDSLCNLDLLFYAGTYTGNSRLLDIATTHATTLLHTHLRTESRRNDATCFSTYHGVNFSPKKGTVKNSFTAQGYADNSTWARGQAWAILGYAQTFSWTKQQKFLDAAKGLAEYFVHRLESATGVIERNGPGRYVPLWDFDAPITKTTVDGRPAPLRDVSAGIIAANGMVILYGQLLGIGDHNSAKRYLDYALAIMKDTVALAYDRDEMKIVLEEESSKIHIEACDKASGRRFDAILGRSTANFNANHADRHWDHGLVYADYYFLELGNRLLDMGLV